MFKYYPHGSPTTVQMDSNNTIVFGGTSDRLAFWSPNNDTIYAVGQDQTIGLSRANGTISIADMAHGLTLDLQTIFGTVNVYGFQNDLTGHITTGAVTLTPDGHGGTLMSGVSGGGSVDFVCDNHVLLTQISQIYV